MSKRLLMVIGLWATLADAAWADELVYFGSRIAAPGQGVFAARFDAGSGRLSPIGSVAEIARPTWLSVHPTLPVLYAVSEVGNDGSVEASVTSLAVDTATGRLSPLNTVGSGGGGATHIAIDEPSRSLFVANYGTGQLSWLPTTPDGRLGMPTAVQSNFGAGPDPRQDSPHPHGVAVDPSHRFVLVADLGADRIFLYRFDAAMRRLLPAEPDAVAAPPGSGPRQLVFHPNGRLLFVLMQMSADLVSYRWDAAAGRLTQVQSTPTEAPGFTGEKRAGYLEFSPDGRFAYATNRGVDALMVFSVDPATGAFREIQRLHPGGKSAMGFAFDPSGRWMLVANNESNTVTVFAVDPATGRLSATAESLAVPQPASVAFCCAAR